MTHDEAEADCRQLTQASYAVRTWFNVQPGVKEESLTDWLLYEISCRSPRFLYYAFTRHQEARVTGADWEWWILLSGENLVLRVQAKRLVSGKNHYGELASTNRHGLQIQKLLDDSKRDNAIPLYALYSANASSTMCPKGTGGHGVFIAGAQRIFDTFVATGPKRVNDAALLDIANPLPCIVCCPLSVDIKAHFLKYFPSESSKDGEGKTMRGLHKELPNYVTTLIESKQPGAPDWWEREFRRQIQDINAILIYDARQSNHEE